MKKYETIGVMGQWLALMATLTGFVILLSTRAPTWHAFVTGGALILTVATKVRYYGDNYIQSKRRKKLIKVTDIIDKERSSSSATKKPYQREAQNG